MNKRIFISLIMGTVLCGSLTMSCSKDDDDKGASDYFYLEGHSYQIVKQEKTWREAAAAAVTQGGYLAEIDTKAEQDAIWQAILKANISSGYAKAPDGGGVGYIWIGGHRVEGSAWVWNGAYQSGTFPLFWYGNQTGSAVGGAYANWGGSSKGSRNEPDNFTDPSLSPNGQNVVAIGLASWPEGSSSPLGIAGEWNDIAETNKLYYVIEFDSEKK
jgi:hypothetical protein